VLVSRPRVTVECGTVAKPRAAVYCSGGTLSLAGTGAYDGKFKQATGIERADVITVRVDDVFAFKVCSAR
jgi:hypothetical protein